ncbi:MAG: biotin carboxylase [Leptospirales bacterium]|nr:biotin carboxylase [Leptospirales bacterium]
MASFSCAHLKILIVCRGPIRKEAMDVFGGLGARYGILLSEKDSVTYPYTLAPELRVIVDDDSVHRVPDYTGASAAERKERIRQIIQIAVDNEYTHLFAGYGFMAEDAEFVESIETAGLGFVGPASVVHRAAGAKDTAKVIARQIGVSVTPGVDNITALTLLRKCAGNEAKLSELARSHGLNVERQGRSLEDYAEAVLQAGYSRSIGLISTEEIQTEAGLQAAELFKSNPGRRIRLKYIGGGGGKGQRIITQAADAPAMALEVLLESKANGPADNKNFLMELNIENTRHNEIQLLGNGEWCVALGGRDCSLQMHEQKLVELSITDELFEYETALAEQEGRPGYAETLKKDRAVLRDMEDQAARFGQAVKLNSASTFECIVSEHSFFFMEMNTRIQVEHRVTEMVYSLKFVNPDDPSDFFIVESLVEAMALCAAHGTRLPKPQRLFRHRAGGEVRLNAMNDALQPHAGGTIENWSPLAPNEVRDDQGIGVPNPDTGWFIAYHLAGAYDSNIALIISGGDGRRHNLENLADILRRMEMRGPELKTNREFHYGILNFCLGLHPMLKPDTKFALPYLAAVGKLAGELASFDLEVAWTDVAKRVIVALGAGAAEVLAAKQTLATRPLHFFVDNPHAAAGWLVRHHRRAFTIESGKVIWKRNPARVLNDLYRYFRLEERPGAAPVQQIWPDDLELLQTGLRFYQQLEEALGVDSESHFEASMSSCRENGSRAYSDLSAALLANQRPTSGAALTEELLAQVAASHRGWLAGMEILDALVLLGSRCGLLDFAVDDALHPITPEEFLNPEAQENYIRNLAPPPPAAADELVAVSGGMFYSREAPGQPPLLEPGKQFHAGDPIYIIEVMKMFNKVYAEFSGTVTESLVPGQDGVVVKKGQPLFRVKPDVEIKIETPEEREARRKQATLEILKAV